MNKLTGAFVAGFLFATLWVGEVCAQSEVGFAVGPLVVNVPVRPGKVSTGNFTIVTQRVTGIEKILLEVSDMMQLDGEHFRPIEIGKGVRSCARWIEIDKEVAARANSTLNVPFTVTCPPRASGEYYAYITTRAIPREGQAQFAATVEPAVNVKIQAVVTNRPTKLGLDIENARVETSSWEESGILNLTVRNTGEIKTPLEGDVLLSSEGKAFPMRVPIPCKRSGESIIIYPGPRVDIRCPLPHSLSPGNYIAQVRGILLGGRRLNALFKVNVGEGKELMAEALWSEEFQINLKVDPEIVKLTLPQGAVRIIPIQIQNTEDQKVYITAEVKRVRVEPNGLFTYADEGGQESSWVDVLRKKLVLNAHRLTTLRARVRIPRSSKANRTSVCAVRLQAHLEDDGEDEKGAISIGEYAVLVIARDLKARPANIRSCTLELIRSSPGKNPSTALLSVKNTGGDIAEISGEIVLMTANGEKMAGVLFGKPKGEIIPPSGERELRLTIPPLDKGEYTVVAKIDSGEGSEILRLEKPFTVETEVPEGLKKAAA